MSNVTRLACVGLLLLGCGGDATEAEVVPDASVADSAVAPIEFCSGSVRFLWDPASAGQLESLPDDYWTVDSDTATGVRIDFGGTPDWMAALPDIFAAVYRDLEGLDGWGINAGVQLRFSAPVADRASAADPDTVGLYALVDGTAAPVPHRVRGIDEGRTLVLEPLRPLRPGTPHAAVVTTGLAVDEDGGCAAPSAALAAVLTGAADDPGLKRLAARYQALPSLLGIEPGDISAAVVFTTQTVFEEAQAFAADVAGRAVKWETPPTCTLDGALRACPGTFVGFDYRADGAMAPTPVGEWTLAVDVFLPAEGEGPWPVLVYGHGINGGRYHAHTPATLLVPLGLAVVAIDAPYHNDHPTANDPEGIQAGLDLLGASLDDFSLDARRIRTSFGQAAAEKLQLIRLLETHPDIDGDGADDLDTGRLAYFGISLGGLMSTQPTALHGAFEVVVSSVGGGKLTTIFSDSDRLSIFVNLLGTLSDDPADAERIIPAVQAVIDAADPATWGTRLVHDRLDGAPPPSVLLNLGIVDDLIPTSATHALARAIEMPVVQPTVSTDSGLSSISAPVTANAAEGKATVALFEFDRVRDGANDKPKAAGHDNTPLSFEGRRQLVEFFRTWLEAGVPTIVDPLIELETPAL